MVDAGDISDESPQGLAPDTLLGKYQIVRLLGAGGMGAVYEAAHTEIGKRVAIKVLSPAIAAVPGARARFLREAQLTSRVRHPNIVDVTDMGSDAGQTYLVMELLRGEDLAQRVVRGGPLEPEALADIMLPVCSAVVEAHKAGITHRDLKPQNIFLAVGPHSMQPKVLDFGISKGNDAPGAGTGTLTSTGAMIGTPFYLAPEQIMDTRSAGPNSDQYALGVIMYECLTGARPFEAENLFVVLQAIVAGNPVPPSQRRLGISPALEGVVLRAMNLSPGARFSSTLALGRALLPFASNRMRSIWEEAFPGSQEMPVEDPSPAAPATTPPAGRSDRPVLAAVDRGSGGQVPPSDPALSSGRRRAALHPPEVPTIPTEAPQGQASRFAASDGARADAGDRLRPNGLRRWTVVIVAAVAAVGLIAGVALRRSAPGPAVPRTPAPAAGISIAGGGQPVAAAVEKGAPSPASVAAVDVPAQTLPLSVRVDPPDATLELDGQPVGRGLVRRELPLDHARHRLRIAAIGFDEQLVEFTDAPPPTEIKLKRSRAGAAATDDGHRRATSRPARHRKSAPASRPPPNPNGAPVID